MQHGTQAGMPEFGANIGLQTFQRGGQTLQDTPLHAPVSAMASNKPLQDDPKGPQDNPKTAPGRVQMPPGHPKTCPRRPQDLQEASKFRLAPSRRRFGTILVMILHRFQIYF